MDQRRRVVLFFVLSALVYVGWMGFVLPRGPANRQQPAAVQEDEELPRAEEAAQTDPEPPPPPQPLAVEPEAAQPADVADVVDNPHRTLTLGSLDPQSGYFLQVVATTRGAAIETVVLNDPRYRSLDNPNEQLAVVRPVIDDEGRERLTLQSRIPALDQALEALGTDSLTADWEVVETIPDDRDSSLKKGVTFRLVSPDGSLEVQKRFDLERVDPAISADYEVRDTDPDGYQLRMTIRLVNRGEQPVETTYTLQGPVGLPLEDPENVRKFRDIRVGFLDEDGDLNSETVHAANVVEQAKENANLEEWRSPLKYVGVDVQYFTALLFPAGETPPQAMVAASRPVLLHEATRKKEFSDISVELTSVALSLPPGQSAEHEYALFAGPKRNDLLAPLGAESTLNFSTWFGIGYVSRGMLWLMKALHGLGIPYGVAIILLTVIVRGAMFPVSRKQALGAKKMRELQPKIEELKRKYPGKDRESREKLARAQMELFSKHNYNPFSGCLPLFIQLPIFIGLYRALGSSVDLRMAPFLWIDNLAAPDALFRLPFALPFLGSNFNLLPLLTVALFVVQQKMFMPPATSPEQAMQQKMMSFFTIFLGFLFYRVPSGLCVYFIASSLWGLAERKLLDLTTSSQPPPAEAQPGTARQTEKKPGLWEQMLQRVEGNGKTGGKKPARSGAVTGAGTGRRKKGRRKSR